MRQQRVCELNGDFAACRPLPALKPEAIHFFAAMTALLSSIAKAESAVALAE